jgi:hypothetical protein
MPRCLSRFPFLCLFSPRQFLWLGSVAITGPDSCFGFHFPVSRFGREARHLMKDLQSSICRPVESAVLALVRVQLLVFVLALLKVFAQGLVFPYQDLGPRKHQGSAFCRFPFCVRSRQELASFSPALARFPLVCDLLNGQILSSCV